MCFEGVSVRVLQRNRTNGVCCVVCVRVCVCRDRETDTHAQRDSTYLKELAHAIVEAGKSKICSEAGTLETQVNADIAAEV